MDLLSIAASILAVLSAVGATAQGLEKLWSLEDTPKELLVVMNEVSGLRTMLRVVEVALRSLQTAEGTSLQDVLHDINALYGQASVTMSELNTLINDKLQSTNNHPTTPILKLQNGHGYVKQRTLRRFNRRSGIPQMLFRNHDSAKHNPAWQLTEVCGVMVQSR